METVLDFMSKDHDRLDEIFKEFQITKNKNYNKAKKLFSDFEKSLKRHIVWEEEILFPLFEKQAKMPQSGMHTGGPTAIMRMEHSQIRDFLEKIQDMLAKRDIKTDELEEWLLEVLQAHNEKEESILYPWIDEAVSKNEIKGAFEKMKKVSQK